MGVGGTVEVEDHGGQPGTAFPGPPADGSFGVVVAAYQTRGAVKAFGVTFRSARYATQIIFIAEPECIVADERGVERVIADGGCASLPATGEVVGGGTTEVGERLVAVELGISEECYRLLPEGSRWPSAIPECAP